MSSGVRCAETMRSSCSTPKRVQISAAPRMVGRSESLPMTMPTSAAIAPSPFRLCAIHAAPSGYRHGPRAVKCVCRRPLTALAARRTLRAWVGRCVEDTRRRERGMDTMAGNGEAAPAARALTRVLFALGAVALVFLGAVYLCAPEIYLADADAAALRGGQATVGRDGVRGRRRALDRLAGGWDRAALALGLLADRDGLHLLRVANPSDGARAGGHPHGGGASVVQRSTRAGGGDRAGHRHLDAAAVPALWRVGKGPRTGERVGEATCAERWAAWFCL